MLLSTSNTILATQLVKNEKELQALTQLLALENLALAKQLQELPLASAREVMNELPLKRAQAVLNILEESISLPRAQQLRVALQHALSESANTSEYLQDGVMAHVRARIGWIIALSVFGMLSGLIISRYEDTLSSMLILVIFMPMMADTGGNVGSQAATLLVRALAIGEVCVSQWPQVLWKEMRVALIISSALVILIVMRVFGFAAGVELPEGISLEMVAMAISLAMIIQVLSSTLIGALLPLLATRLRLDPAVIVSPVLTTVVDITGMLIYFFTITTLLGI